MHTCINKHKPMKLRGGTYKIEWGGAMKLRVGAYEIEGGGYEIDVRAYEIDIGEGAMKLIGGRGPRN